MRDYVIINKKVYNNLAKEYCKRVKKCFFHNERITKPFIEYLKQNINMPKILELGCGNGLNLVAFEKEGLEPFAIDISNKMIGISKKRTINTKYFYGDFLEYDFKDLKFDGIFASAFIHLFSKKDAILVLEKIKNLLTNKGIIFLSTTIHQNSEEGFFEKEDYCGGFKRFRKKWIINELINTLKDLKFQIIRWDFYLEEERKKLWVNLILAPNLITPIQNISNKLNVNRR